MPQPATPPAPPVHAHNHGHSHSHGHEHGHGHGHAHDQPAATTRPVGPSLLMAGVGARLLGVAGLLLVLWAAVLWALGDPA